jgi:uncharacterized protein DUF3592
VPVLPWFVYAMLLAPFGLILFAAAYKYLQVRAAGNWPSTPGRVVVSTSEVRNLRVLDDSHEDGRSFEPRNFANIVYEYTVSGQKLTNNRVSIAEDRGNFEVAETIARYPVGAAVTVYYNSLHPRDAVLERDLPKGMAGCLAIGAVIVLTIVFGGVIGVNRINGLVSAHLADPKLSPLVVVLGAFGGVIALFGVALHRQASLAKKWPVVTGTIEVSRLEPYRAAPSASGVRGPIMVPTQVSYAYRFNNVAYSNVYANLSSNVPSSSNWLLRKLTPGYQNGDSVRVYVDPANPSRATLNPGSGIAWLLWATAVALLALAYYVATGASGLIRH